MASKQQIVEFIRQFEKQFDEKSSDEILIRTYNKYILSGNPHAFRDSLCGLNAIFYLTDPDPDYLVIGFHGFGSSGSDMFDMGMHIADMYPTKRVLYAFPNGPLTVGPDAHAWFPRFISGLMAKYNASKYSEIISYPFDQVNETREKTRRFIGNLLLRFNIPAHRTSFFGFSQGGMMTIDTAMMAPVAPQLAVEYSGLPINTSAWEKKWNLDNDPTRFKNCLVHLNHGTRDQMIDFEGFLLFEQELKKYNIGQITTNTFEGSHTIDRKGQAALMNLIGKLPTDVTKESVDERMVIDAYLDNQPLSTQLTAIIGAWKALKAIVRGGCQVVADEFNKF
eukprot:GDKJ01029292.1.p1 GENE.GDKJ01029292.1~~GDKJ01029292.1.p1  ORF type:complete len:336 (-),score=63.12 GDKJ01029292.1:174-1181(-)